MRRRFIVCLFFIIPILTAFKLSAQFIDSARYNNMRWRSIGPYRGGRTVGAAGIPSQPNVFYIGVNNGGVWKTTDYGRTWFPIFDDQPTGSIGTIAIAPSDPNIIYVGSGEGLHRPDLSTGDGIYKSTDAGKTWTHLGLRDGQQIPKITVDPKNPDRIFAAVLGHPYGPNEERGIFESMDGGKTFEKILYIDENTGGDDVEIDPSNPDIIFATLWQSREGPWENGEWSGTKGGIFKSSNGGKTWKKLSKDFPGDMVQAHIAIAPSSSNIIYAAIGTSESNEYGTGEGMGIYRSDDGGENWKEISQDGRPEARIGGGDVPEIMVDPKDPEKVYSTSIAAWRSTDGAKTWKSIRGAPGGDDYQNIWINSLNTDILLVTGDQGAIITVNGGETWSSWYNQPTAQLYHVSADNAFPYNVYSGQQESGSVGISSRGNDGQITFRDWHPVGAEEYGYVAPDPLNSNIIYGGKISRYNKTTGQAQNITPQPSRNGEYRFVRTEPVIFSPIDHKTLYFAGNVLFKTHNGGDDWQVISPDLSREAWDIPASVGIYSKDDLNKMRRRGVIYTVSPSSININTIWAGTDDGYIHLTKDAGKTWQNITPNAVTSWSKISLIDAGHFDVNTAYAAINRIRCDDMHPYIFKTKDGGKTWTNIVNGLPNNPVNAVREDPIQKGLLFAATETAVYFSTDDGQHWQSLRRNMPASSIRDIIVKDNDLVVATHGRGFWILDDMSQLREMAATPGVKNVLYKPATTYRVRWNNNTDTPLPPDEPAGENPPNGAIIDYYLADPAKNVTLEIIDAKGNIVDHFSSHDTLYKIPASALNIPLFWIRPQQLLSAANGSHRFIWDLHYTPMNTPPSYPISAIYKNTAPRPTSPCVMPGDYILKLSIDGKEFSQPIAIKMDSRVKTSTADLQKQHDLSIICYDARKKIIAISQTTVSVHNQLMDLGSKVTGELAASLKSFDNKITTMDKRNPAEKLKGFSEMYAAFTGLFDDLQDADMPVPSQVSDAVIKNEIELKRLCKNWDKKKSEITAINKQLEEAGMPIIKE